jgi:hypothetical protein
MSDEDTDTRHDASGRRVCPVCGEPLGDAMEGNCSRCGSYILINRVTGEPVHMPQAPAVARQRGIFWPIVGALLFFFVGIPIIVFVVVPMFSVGVFGTFGGSDTATGVVMVVAIALVGFVIIALLDRRRRRKSGF